MMYEDRIAFLLSTRKFELAEREIRAALAQQLENPQLHAFLALCMLGQRRPKEALEPARQALGLAPDFPLPYLLLSQAWYELEDMKQARQAIQQAIALDPLQADFYIHLAAIDFYERKWEQALQAVEKGLALNPEQVDGINIRARILLKLGRASESAASFEASLNKDPDNSYTHSNKGWALLEGGEYRAALSHFREALRLNPENESAREGLIEALKARYWIYRAYLRFAFAMNNMSQGLRWGLIIGAILVVRLLPVLAPAYLVLVFFSWFSDILFNTLLRFNPYGRYALNERERHYSNLFAACLLSGLLALGYGMGVGDGRFEGLGIVLLGMLFPITGTFNTGKTRKRKHALLYTYLLAALGAIFVIAEFAGASVSGTLFFVFLLGAVGFTWWVQIAR